jgi:hypothetical protein
LLFINRFDLLVKAKATFSSSQHPPNVVEVITLNTIYHYPAPDSRHQCAI